MQEQLIISQLEYLQLELYRVFLHWFAWSVCTAALYQLLASFPGPIREEKIGEKGGVFFHIPGRDLIACGQSKPC